LAKRLCQAAIGALIDWRKAGYDLARDATGEAFDRLFPDRRSKEQRLLDAALSDFETNDLGDDAASHLAAVASDLLLWHGLSIAEIANNAEPDVPRWADRAMQAVCVRGVRPSTMPGLAPSGPRTPDGNPLVEIDQGLEQRLKSLVARVYRQLLANLDPDLQVAFFGRLILDVGEIKAVVEETSGNVRQIREDVSRLVRPPDSSPPFSVPPPVLDFIGYEKEIEQVCSALANGSAAISAVQGIGGVGKTELARKVAALVREEFRDGQILVDMLGTTQPRDARDAMTDVLVALGEQDIRPDTLAGQYQSRLAGKRLLILLDNVASRAGLGELVPPAPAALLVTSRTRLALPGVVPVELEKLSREAAKTLLARMVPALDDAVLDELARLCADLPLTLRVAGSYLQEIGYPAPAYVAELKERRLARLARSADAVEDAELNPEIVLGHSYDRLAGADPNLARAFAQLGVFPDDFDLAGAAAVFGTDEGAAREFLTQLRRRSLVQQPEDRERWRLHDLLRELAEARAEPAEREAAAERYQAHFLALLAWCAEEVFNRRQKVNQALDRFETEHPNMIAAVGRAGEEKDFAAAAAAHAHLGLLAGEIGRREEAPAATEEAVGLYRRLAEARPDAFLHDLAGSLNNLGGDLDAVGRREDALAATEEAVGLYRRLAEARPDASLPGLATSLDNLGIRLSAVGRREDALAATEEAVAIRRSLAEARPDAFLPDLAMSLNNLGIRLSAVGRREDALAATEEAVGLDRRLAEARPDAFLPGLALALAVRANCLEGLERMTEALSSDVEAIEALQPAFLRHPRAVVHWMRPMCGRYADRCKKLGIEPNTGLLGPIEAVLRELDGAD
jgi:hypothetical protein